jgi:orotate phosphoribosyltransferase
LHSERYLQSALVLQYPEFAESLGKQRARSASEAPPAYGDPLAGARGHCHRQEVGRALGIRAMFAERQEEATLRRGFSLALSDRVVVVETCDHRGSTRETIDVALALGASVAVRRVAHRSRWRRRQGSGSTVQPRAG